MVEDPFRFIPDRLRRLWDSWDLEESQEGVKALMAKDKEGTIRDLLGVQRQLYAGWLSELAKLGLLQQPLLQAVASAFFDLSQRAMRKDWHAYRAFRNEYDPELQYMLEWVRTADYAGLILGRDYSNLDAALTFMRSGLENYVRRLRYYAALLEIVQGKSLSFERVRRLDWGSLEGRLLVSPDGIGLGVVLGPEYRHIRNALTHGSYKVYPRRKELTFTDLNQRTGESWKRTYEFKEFLSVQQFFVLVFYGIDLAQQTEILAGYETISGAMPPKDAAAEEAL